MKITRQFARRFRLLRILRASLLAGAVYDGLFAVLMVLAPDLPAELLALPLPGEAFYLWIMATFLVMLAALYLFAAHDPRRYSGIIVVAIAGRTLGAIAFAAAAIAQPELSGLWILAGVDLVFAVAHGFSWLPLRV